MKGINKNISSRERKENTSVVVRMNKKSKKKGKEDKTPKCFDKFRCSKEGAANLNEDELELH